MSTSPETSRRKFERTQSLYAAVPAEAMIAEPIIREPQMSLAFEEAPSRVDVHPIVKWAGGKGQLLSQLACLFPHEASIRRYYEPFLGGAAIFFSYQHAPSVLSDSNAELINMYRAVRERLPELIRELQTHVNTAEHFYEVRALRTCELTDVERAARFIYLNKTCFNGLYRVNRSGQFNVPFGRYKNPTICDTLNLEAASLALSRAELRVADYETALSAAERGDFIYFDPPYQPLSKTASFTSYTNQPFGEQEQERLAHFYKELDRRGCYIMLSNSDTSLIRDLYREFSLQTVLANRAISSKATTRGPVSEVVVINYNPQTGELNRHETGKTTKRYSMGALRSRKEAKPRRHTDTGGS